AMKSCISTHHERQLPTALLRHFQKIYFKNYLQRDFCQNIERALSTWENTILSPFLITLKESIDEKFAIINDLKNENELLFKKITANQKIFQIIKEKISTYTEKYTYYKNLQNHDQQEIEEIIQMQLDEVIFQRKNILCLLNSKLEDRERDICENWRQYAKLYYEIHIKKTEIYATMNKISKYNNPAIFYNYQDLVKIEKQTLHFLEYELFLLKKNEHSFLDEIRDNERKKSYMIKRSDDYKKSIILKHIENFKIKITLEEHINQLNHDKKNTNFEIDKYLQTMKSNHAEILKSISELLSNYKMRSYYAVIIKTQYDLLLLLNQLAELHVNNDHKLEINSYKSEGINPSDLYLECEKFIEFYKKHTDLLKNEVETALDHVSQVNFFNEITKLTNECNATVESAINMSTIDKMQVLMQEEEEKQEIAVEEERVPKPEPEPESEPEPEPEQKQEQVPEKKQKKLQIQKPIQYEGSIQSRFFPMPKVNREQSYKEAKFKPTVTREQSDKDAESNPQVNCKYQYEVEAMSKFLQLKILEIADHALREEIKVLTPTTISNNASEELYDNVKSALTSKKTILLIPCHVHGGHWTGLLLRTDKESITQAHYYDSSCDVVIPKLLENQITSLSPNVKLEIKESLKQSDGSSCGAYVVENLFYAAQSTEPLKDLDKGITIRLEHLALLKKDDLDYYLTFYYHQINNISTVPSQEEQMASQIASRNRPLTPEQEEQKNTVEKAVINLKNIVLKEKICNLLYFTEKTEPGPHKRQMAIGMKGSYDELEKQDADKELLREIITTVFNLEVEICIDHKCPDLINKSLKMEYVAIEKINFLEPLKIVPKF
ncbi:MAG: hypothetical protein K2Q14_01780, partial [Gammaproteobacteria bacterium]|nr:hypothetical protein [Gammaproteobacteria bacterium]